MNGSSNIQQSSSGLTTINVLNVNSLFIRGVPFLDLTGAGSTDASLQAQITQINAEIAVINGEIASIEAITNRIDLTGLTGNLVITDANKNSVLLGYITTLQGQVATLQGQIVTIQGDITTLQGQVATIQGQITTIQGQIATIQGQIATIQATIAHFSTWNDWVAPGSVQPAVTMSGIRDGTGFAVALDNNQNGNGLYIYPEENPGTEALAGAPQIRMETQNGRQLYMRGGSSVEIYAGSDGTLLERNAIFIGDTTDNIKIGSFNEPGGYALIEIGAGYVDGGNASTTIIKGDIQCPTLAPVVPTIYTDIVNLGLGPNYQLSTTTDPTLSGLDIISIAGEVAPVTITCPTGLIQVSAGLGAIDLTALAGGIFLTTGAGALDLTTGAGAMTLSTGAGAMEMSTGAGIFSIQTGAGDIDVKTTNGNITIGAGQAGGVQPGNTGDTTISAHGGIFIQPQEQTADPVFGGGFTTIEQVKSIYFKTTASPPPPLPFQGYPLYGDVGNAGVDALFYNNAQLATINDISGCIVKINPGTDISVDNTNPIQPIINSLATRTYSFPTQTAPLGITFPSPIQLGVSNVKIVCDLQNPTPASSGLINLNMNPLGPLGLPIYSVVPAVVISSTCVYYLDDANGAVHQYNPSAPAATAWTYSVLRVFSSSGQTLRFFSAVYIPPNALNIGYQTGGVVLSGNFDAARVGTGATTFGLNGGIFFWDQVSATIDSLTTPGFQQTGTGRPYTFTAIAQQPVSSWVLNSQRVLFWVGFINFAGQTKVGAMMYNSGTSAWYFNTDVTQISWTRNIYTLSAQVSSGQVWLFIGGNQLNIGAGYYYGQIAYYNASTASFAPTTMTQIGTPGAVWDQTQLGIGQSNWDSANNLYFNGGFSSTTTTDNYLYNNLNPFTGTYSTTGGLITFYNSYGDSLIYQIGFQVSPTAANVTNIVANLAANVSGFPYITNVTTPKPFGQNPQGIGLNMVKNCTASQSYPNPLTIYNATTTQTIYASNTYTYAPFYVYQNSIPVEFQTGCCLRSFELYVPANCYQNFTITMYDGNNNIRMALSRQMTTGAATTYVNGYGFCIWNVEAIINAAQPTAQGYSYPICFDGVIDTTTFFTIQVTWNNLSGNYQNIAFYQLSPAIPPMSVYMCTYKDAVTTATAGNLDIALSGSLVFNANDTIVVGFVPTQVNWTTQSASPIIAWNNSIYYNMALYGTGTITTIQESAYIAQSGGVPSANPIIQIPSVSGGLPQYPCVSQYAANLQYLFKCSVGDGGSTISVVEWNGNNPTSQPISTGLNGGYFMLTADTTDPSGQSIYINARNTIQTAPFIPAFYFGSRTGNNQLIFSTGFNYNLGTTGFTGNVAAFGGQYSTISLTKDDDNPDTWVVVSYTGNVSFSNK